MSKPIWHLYILQCADSTLYTGITTDIVRRLNEHNNSAKGAKYTRARRPVALVYSELCESRSSAASREYEIKKLPKPQKLELIQSAINTDSLSQDRGGDTSF